MADFTNQDILTLRSMTGAGMADCKKALIGSNGDIDAAVKFLREKGIASAAKKAGRIAGEGIVDSYIHMGGKIGVMLEVNCETDFVARSDEFRDLVHNLCMQIAAAKPDVVSVEDVDPAKIATEKEILYTQARNEPKPKPEAVIEKMVEGRIQKYFSDVCLLEQVYVRNNDFKVKDIINQAIAKIGEKISVRRFVRYEMGEGLEKRKDNFAEEVAEQVNAIK